MLVRRSKDELHSLWRGAAEVEGREGHLDALLGLRLEHVDALARVVVRVDEDGRGEGAIHGATGSAGEGAVTLCGRQDRHLADATTAHFAPKQDNNNNKKQKQKTKQCNRIQ